jgi:RNA polymerase sigma factor (sigma-70 family)
VNATLVKLTQLTSDPLTAGDGPLLDAFIAGDQTAFAALVRRYAELVFATCRRTLRHHQDAEDAFQATFLVLARRAADVWPREALGSWLFGVAHRVALKARSVRTRRAARTQPLEDVASAERPACDFDLAEAVHRVVFRLPEVYRAAVVACDLEGLSRKEAAERLGWSEGTLSGRLARARELLAGRFCRAGLTLPAGGLAAVFAVSESASARSIQTTIDLATGTAGTASAPVAALTEGVVRSMAFLKLKTMTAAVFAALAIGFGALAASGVGAGDGTGQPKQSQKQSAPVVPGVDKPPAKQPADPKEARAEAARWELDMALRDIEFAGLSEKLDRDTLDRIRRRLENVEQVLASERPTKAPTDRDRLQGSWRVISLTEDGKTTPTNPKDPWVIEFASRTLRMPYLETDSGWKQREYVFAVEADATPRTIAFFAPNKPVGRAVYEFTLPSAQCASCHMHPFAKNLSDIPKDGRFGVCDGARKDPATMAGAGVRLGISPSGARGIKFDTPGVIVFELRRPGTADPNRTAPKADPGAEFDAKQELDRLATRLEKAHLAAARAKSDFEVAAAALEKAKQAEKRARFDYQDATVDVVMAHQEYERAKERLEKKATPPAPAAAAEFTVHVRTLTAAEKVIRVKATGKETVLEGLTHAADVSIKSDALSVWVVRDKTVLPVDLPAITNGDAKTNYALKAGDKLFVQVKAAK